MVEADILPENLNLDIYYEDDDVAVVYKPRHGSSSITGHYTNTLVNGLMYQIKICRVLMEKFVRIVHRIDMDTSGLLMVAKMILLIVDL